MSDRYFVEKPIAADCVTLVGPEAHHLIHVMRADPGAQVTLFDGSGAEFPAIVERVGRSDVALTVLSREPIDRELPFEITLGVALPKGERQKWLVEKAVELGVARIVPLRTQRGVAQPVEQTLARLRRTVVEASKQCRRNRLLEIADPRSWPDFITETPPAPRRLLAHPAVKAAVKGDAALFLPGPVVLAVGPEGGFTDDEVVSAVAAGWQTVNLGPRILRVETASLLLVARVVSG